MGTSQTDLGKEDYWGPGPRQIQNINSVWVHLSLPFICFIVFPQDFTTVTQRHKFSTMTTHTHAHTFFSLTVMAVAVSIYYFGRSCLAGIQFNVQVSDIYFLQVANPSCKSTIKLWGEEVKKCWGLADPVPFLCLHLCPVTQVHHSPPLSFTWYSMQVFHTHTLICTAGWIATPPHTPPPNLPGSLLEFPAARQSLFSQVIAQGILIKVKICCWKVTFQTSCDFRCEIKWADFPVSDKHPVTDEGYFKESALCSDPSRRHLFGITSARMGLSDSQTRWLLHLMDLGMKAGVFCLSNGSDWSDKRV